ncbi:MAG: 30S ribosomal protein S16 [Bdellovibrionales bacterium]|nr:30S ribosomal protein S16 [Bdellovibrionales bacterium]
MAVVIRLSRKGQKKRPFYRLVAAEKGSKRDGRFLEILGTYNPMLEEEKENLPKISLKEDRIQYWLGNGALPTKVARSVIFKGSETLKKEITETENARIEKKRAKRKARAAKQKSAA